MRDILNAAMLAVLLSMTTGCAWILGLPKIESKDMPDVMKALATDTASVCAWFGGRGGGGGGAITPVPVVPAGGYGSGEILVGRVNADNTTIVIQNGSCTISRGVPQVKETIP